MDVGEIRYQMMLSYGDLVAYLITKYGDVKYNYFTNETCATKTRGLTRTRDGLICHHIDEDKADKLSDPQFAIRYPFEYQKAERLVYCNYLEHLLLHISISKLRHEKHGSKIEDVKNLSRIIMPGVRFICADLNWFYDHADMLVGWKKNCYDTIADNYDDYIDILRDFIRYIRQQYTKPIRASKKLKSEIDHIRFLLSSYQNGYFSESIYDDLEE